MLPRLPLPSAVRAAHGGVSLSCAVYPFSFLTLGGLASLLGSPSRKLPLALGLSSSTPQRSLRAYPCGQALGLPLRCAGGAAAAGVEGVTAHGFRRGGATALASAGVAPEAIRLAGRWASGSFSVWRYADPTVEQSAGLAQLMARPLRIAGDARLPEHAPTRTCPNLPTRASGEAGTGTGSDGDSCGSA